MTGGHPKGDSAKKNLKDLKAMLDNVGEDRDGSTFDLDKIKAELQLLGVDLALATKPTEWQMVCSGRKGKSVNRPPGGSSVVPADGLCSCWAAAWKNYCEDSDANYVP